VVVGHDCDGCFKHITRIFTNQVFRLVKFYGQYCICHWQLQT